MTGQTSLRRLGRSAAKRLPLSWLPLDFLLRAGHRVQAALATLVFWRDWKLEARGRPQFFKHEINLARWIAEPSRWAFTARGVYAREHMFRGCKVLDLCCGDGTYSYLFFSDIAARIDAVDNDRHALDYARKHRAASSISYRALDIIEEPFPATDYDVVVWNAAICYFAAPEIDRVLGKIASCGKPGMVLCGMLPKANGWVDHKTEFADASSVERLLARFFSVVAMKEVDEGAATTFYFQASQSKHASP